MTPLTHVDLFSGIGGFAYGLQTLCGGFKTVALCEINKACHPVLQKNFPGVPIHDDVHTFPWYRYPATDIVSAGFPCQNYSTAGKQTAQHDKRYVWPALVSIIENMRPRWAVFENVVGIINLELDSIIDDLATRDYTARTFVIPAYGVNGKHRRSRVWIVANTERYGRD